MNHHHLIRVLLPCIISTLMHPLASLGADDPLNAFPTAEKPVDQRVSELTPAELQAIRVPAKDDQLVFSIAMVPFPADQKDDEQNDAAKTGPWLRVFANGRLDGGSHQQPSDQRRADTLTKAELTWLLHLAVNECQILTRSTNDIWDPPQKQPPNVLKGRPQRIYQYHLNLNSGKNDLLIPEMALVMRPTRNRLKLDAFASLNKYANYLVARAWLGDPTERQTLLDQLNEKLKADHPDLPPFAIEHLGAAVPLQNMDLSAVFQQEIVLGENQFKRVAGHILRKEKGAVPIFMIHTMDDSKDRFQAVPRLRNPPDKNSDRSPKPAR